MSLATLILGESGTGKTASLRNLDPKQTLLIQAIRKPLPFKSPEWKVWNKAEKSGNIIVSDDSGWIEKAMRSFDHPVVVIDDWQYILANEFMRRSDERGFEKFTDIGRHAWNVLQAASGLAESRRVYILAHTATDDLGKTRIKTIGKLLDEKITVEGMVSTVLRTSVMDGVYRFATRNSGNDTVKSPMGMFDEPFIDNDLKAVDDAICDYYGLTATA
jgi:hypothetical protein